jgi:hypothetical protein
LREQEGKAHHHPRIELLQQAGVLQAAGRGQLSNERLPAKAVTATKAPATATNVSKPARAASFQELSDSSARSASSAADDSARLKDALKARIAQQQASKRK